MSSTAIRAPRSAIDLVILLVANPNTSAAFYRNLLGLEPVEESETFAMFSLPNGLKFGLWSSATVAPRSDGAPGASEVCLVDEDVEGVYAAWNAGGVRIALPPTDMDFGRTFVALDPDGHRIRVFRPTEEAGDGGE